MASVFTSIFLVFWIAAGSNVIDAQDVIFDNNENSGDTCTTKEGGAGRCVVIGKCPQLHSTFFTNPPVHCSFSGFLPVICCPVTADPVTEDPDTKPVPVLDISPPSFSSSGVCGLRGRNIGGGGILGDPEDALFRRFKRSRILDNLEVERRPDVDIHHPVVGGFESERNSWPWMALLGAPDGTDKINWFCAGVLINDRWVLTSAHCLDDITPKTVRLGEHDYDSRLDGANPIDFSIVKIISYPNYTYPEAYHDLALLQLSSKVTIQRHIRPVCLPWGTESDKNLTETKVKLTGWGDTEFFGKASSTLQEVDLTMFPNSECEASYSKLRLFGQSWPNGIGKETACAGDRNGGRDACQGDSGGPITYRSRGRYIVNGIVSRGYGCGHKDYPGIYANVQYPPHLAWIKKVAF